MATVDEYQIVRVPCALGRKYLRRYIREAFSKRDGRLTLSVATPARRPNGDPTELREDVLIDFNTMVDLRLWTGKSAIAWRPVHGGGMIPSFSGLLTITAGNSDDTCRLALSGGYDPPMGPIGALFDAAVGNAIAKATAQNLLKSIGQDIERMHFESTLAHTPLR